MRNKRGVRAAANLPHFSRAQNARLTEIIETFRLQLQGGLLKRLHPISARSLNVRMLVISQLLISSDVRLALAERIQKRLQFLGTTPVTASIYDLRCYMLGLALLTARNNKQISYERLAERSGISLELVLALETAFADLDELSEAQFKRIWEILSDDPTLPDAQWDFVQKRGPIRGLNEPFGNVVNQALEEMERDNPKERLI